MAPRNFNDRWRVEFNVDWSRIPQCTRQQVLVLLAKWLTAVSVFDAHLLTSLTRNLQRDVILTGARWLTSDKQFYKSKEDLRLFFIRIYAKWKQIPMEKCARRFCKCSEVFAFNESLFWKEKSTWQWCVVSKPKFQKQLGLSGRDLLGKKPQKSRGGAFLVFNRELYCNCPRAS